MNGLARLRPGEAERGAVHEAGHAIIGLSLGVPVERIERIEGKELSAAIAKEGFDSSAAVVFSEKELRALEPRRQFLILMGGISAETAKFGSYLPQSAAQDFEDLKPNVLTGAEINGLVEIAQSMILPNLGVFHFIKEALFEWLNNSEPLLSGQRFNEKFAQRGKSIDVTERLDKLLPL
jgi:hypothetical protein